MLTNGQAYVEHGIEAFENRSKEKQLRSLQRKARKLGLTLREAAQEVAETYSPTNNQLAYV